MNTLNVILTSLQLSGASNFINHYFFLDPVYGTNFTYPNTANGSLFNTTTGTFVYPNTAFGGFIFPWGYSVQNTFTFIDLGILKGPYTITFVPSGIDNRFYTTTKIIYDFGDGDSTVIEKDVVIDYKKVSLAGYTEGTEIGNPKYTYVSHDYYPLNNDTTTYTVLISVITGDSVYNIFSISFSSIPLSFYDIDNFKLLNKIGLSNNQYENMLVAEAGKPCYITNFKLLSSL